MSVSLYGGTITLTVEAALSAATGDYGAWDSGLWNTATWGPDVIWVDVSAYVRSVTTARRFSRDLQAWEAGTATIVLNNRDGRFSAENLSGPYVTGGITQIRPWRPVRVRAAYAGVTYDVYTGYAQGWNEGWTLGAAGAGDAIVTVPCVDELGRLAGFDGYATSSQGAGETSGKRIHRVLNNAGHAGNRAVDDGTITVQATTLAANAVTELKLTADSEGGSLYVDGAGTVVYERQFALVENSRSITVQATFGDGGGSELAYSALDSAYDGDLTKNIVGWARAGSSVQTVADATSRALYGDLRSTRTDLVCETDAQVLQLASWYLARYKAPEIRFTGIEIKPRRDPATLWPQVLGRRVRDLIRVKRRPAGGLTLTRDVFISGIAHTITPNNWVTKFGLWSATPYTTFASSRWDAATWDTSLFFY